MRTDSPIRMGVGAKWSAVSGGRLWVVEGEVARRLGRVVRNGTVNVS